MKRIIVLFFAVAIGVVLGMFIKIPGEDQTEKGVCSGKYNFVNEQFDCLKSNTISKKEYTYLVARLNSFIDDQKKSESASIVAIYFRDLNQGPTFGINRDSKFIPASLLKVPLLMGLYNASEAEPDILKERIKYKVIKTNVKQELVEIPPLEVGRDYSVEELVDRMIIYSDNDAFNTLQNWLLSKYPGDDFFVKTLTELGLAYPRDSSENTFTAKSYASIFRQLYNASYLSFDSSEKVLEIMSKSKYSNGLVSGVPKNLKVAHKFGIRDSLVSKGVELHDCGIIYYPNNPYLLCVMTRGQDLTNLETTISTVSRMVYEEVDSRKN